MLKNLTGAGLIAAISILHLCSAQLPSVQLDQLSANDKDFIEYAGEIDLAAIRFAQMAQMDAASPQIKSFAEMIEREHAADLKKLVAIANKAGGITPNTLDDVHMNAVKQLKKYKGKSFDHQFLKIVINEHERAIISFQREADNGFNPRLQAYAKTTLVSLQAHLKKAKQLS
ncbi:MAG: DUF4142 domain-containing protein [Acidobacteriota bacterium]|nr:DUF4142 domain-containing protein [Acidobacteriota bacterium]